MCVCASLVCVQLGLAVDVRDLAAVAKCLAISGIEINANQPDAAVLASLSNMRAAVSPSFYYLRSSLMALCQQLPPSCARDIQKLLDNAASDAPTTTTTDSAPTSASVSETDKDKERDRDPETKLRLAMVSELIRARANPSVLDSDGASVELLQVCFVRVTVCHASVL